MEIYISVFIGDGDGSAVPPTPPLVPSFFYIILLLFLLLLRDVDDEGYDHAAVGSRCPPPAPGRGTLW